MRRDEIRNQRIRFRSGFLFTFTLSPLKNVQLTTTTTNSVESHKKWGPGRASVCRAYPTLKVGRLFLKRKFSYIKKKALDDAQGKSTMDS